MALSRITFMRKRSLRHSTVKNYTERTTGPGQCGKFGKHNL